MFVELRGIVNKRGKLRVHWLQQLESLIVVARGLDQLLGLGRREKRIPSLSEYLARLAKGEREGEPEQ